MSESMVVTKQQSLIEALESTWTRHAQDVALVYGEHETTYGDLGRSILKLAGAYRRLHIHPGDRIACSVSNRPELVIAMGAAWACGAIHVGIDFLFTPFEISAVLDLTKASVLVLELGESLTNLKTISEKHPHLRIFILSGGMDSGTSDFSALLNSDNQDDEAVELACDYPLSPDPAIIFISSGTTGRPKATVGFHGNLAQRWQRLAGWLKFAPTDVHLAQLPLSHGFGLMMAMGALLTGGKLVLVNRFSGEGTLRTISTQGVTVLNGSPTHFKLILKHLDEGRYQTKSLRLSVGTAAFFPPELIRSIWERLGVQFMFMYGSSEGVGVATTDREEMLQGSVGKPSPGSVTIVGPDQRPLPVGETGEIAFSRTVFPVRYWEDDGAHRSSDAAPVDAEGKDRWYYSGDRGRLDADGRLYVFGRVKHQIDRGGLKVDPVEVEMALFRTPEIVDAAVLGLPNPVLGETVCACVVPAEEAALTLEKLRRSMQLQLAPYKLPEELILLDRIPRTQLGKVDLEKLKIEIESLTIEHLSRS